MGLLSWDKPERVMGIEEWKAISADNAPPGVYVPNMTVEEQEKWKAEYKGQQVGKDRVEIRKTLRAAQVVLVVTLVHAGIIKQGDLRESYPTYLTLPGVNVKLSANAGLEFSFAEFEQMRQAVEEAREVLLARTPALLRAGILQIDGYQHRFDGVWIRDRDGAQREADMQLIRLSRIDPVYWGEKYDIDHYFGESVAAGATILLRLFEPKHSYAMVTLENVNPSRRRIDNVRFLRQSEGI